MYEKIKSKVQRMRQISNSQVLPSDPNLAALFVTFEKGCFKHDLHLGNDKRSRMEEAGHLNLIILHLNAENPTKSATLM